MPTTAQAAVYRKDQEGLSIEEITVDDPLEREILIRSVATGVCHSDLHVIDGHINAGRGPLVLGHEGAGVVEAVGPGVSHVKPGDHVVTCLSGFCGQCEQCLSGHPNLCIANPTSRTREQPSRLTQGDQRVFAFAGLASFAEMMLVHEHSVVKIDDDLPFDAASLVGCGVLTGMGAALRTARVQAGQTVAVFGCGGVGLSIIQGAALAGAARIIAVDQVDAKLDLARSLGATDGVNATSVDPVEASAGSRVDEASITASRRSASRRSFARQPNRSPCAERAPSSASHQTVRCSKFRSPPSARNARSRPPVWDPPASVSIFPATSSSIAVVASNSTRSSPGGRGSTRSTMWWRRCTQQTAPEPSSCSTKFSHDPGFHP